MDTTAAQGNTWDGDTSGQRSGTENWVRIIDAPEKVPDGFKPFLPPFTDGFPRTLLLPAERGFLSRPRPARLVCVYGDRLTVYTPLPQGSVDAQTIPFDGISVLIHGKHLLQSWLTLKYGSSSCSLHYNTVCESAFEPVIGSVRTSFRRDGNSDGADGIEDERKKFQCLVERDYKYMNYGSKRVMRGDTVEVIAHQPQLPHRDFRFLGMTLLSWKLVSHVAFLTGSELCLIQEENPIRETRSPGYGVVTTFVPLSRIAHIELRKNDTGSFTRMSVRTDTGSGGSALIAADNWEFEVLFEALERSGITVVRNG